MSAELTWTRGDDARLIGRHVPRIDGPDKVTGRAVYPHDKRFESMVWAEFVPCPVPSANVEFDFEAALAVPGVVHAAASVTAACIMKFGPPSESDAAR